MPSRQKLIFALVVLVIAAITGAGALWLTGSLPRGPIGSGTALVGGPFTLTDQNGKRVTDQDFRGKYMLIFFGFTFCPDVCPSELQVMSAALDQMGSEADKIQPVFITIDPARDTPEAMKVYVSNFHPRLIGLTGSEADIAAVAKAYRVYYAKAKGTENQTDYLMDHSTILYLMGPDGKFVKHFTYGTEAKGLAEALRQAVQQ
ncbi:SCO family protein [Taklimakanibacter deserti]|uniref:SCO family protein n=1 Tax=Taklimakanibacter deserti TaxID=2267839 RepID=UPI000E65131F